MEYNTIELGFGLFDAPPARSPEPPVTPASAPAPSAPMAQSSPTSPTPPTVDQGTPAPATSTIPEFVSPPPNAEEYWDADNDDVEPRYRTVDNVLGATSPPGYAARQVAAQLHLQIEEEPATFAEAEKYQPWRRVMMEEMDSIESNKTWRLVPLPPGHRPIGLKWVFKVKKNAAGEVVKHKARLVAKGYVQQLSIDFDEVLLALAA